MSIKERVKEYCDLKHTKIGSFCRYAGISQSYFSQVKGDIGRDIQTRIQNTYPDLNVEWLRTGEGEMLVKDPEAVMTPYPVEGVGTDKAVAIEQPPIVPDRIVRNPEVNVMQWLDNSEGEHSQNAFNIASIMRRTKFVIQMNNNAMSPTLYQNEYVFLKPFAANSEIIDGEIYGIETKARGILIRFLYDDGDYYITHPKNTLEYGEIRILKKDVLNKYHIVFHGSTHLSSLPDNEAERTKRIAQQGEQINSLMGELCKAGERNDRLISIIEKKL